ncbi:MAG TPA: hypothetical protein PLI07_13810, partial [Candidatus Hydrogenedentes bacterium]|nr:hypothetical protein [Candidatus Hydrogenedentota bacterium]
MTNHIRFAMAAALVYASGAAGAVWHVNVNSTAQSPDGVSWATAYRTIQEGIDAAFGAGGGEVWVAAGAYNESRASNESNSLLLKSGVAVYGGFAGVETARNQRDWAARATLIDGNTQGGRAYHVVIGS